MQNLVRQIRRSHTSLCRVETIRAISSIPATGRTGFPIGLFSKLMIGTYWYSTSRLLLIQVRLVHRDIANCTSLKKRNSSMPYCDSRVRPATTCVNSPLHRENVDSKTRSPNLSDAIWNLHSLAIIAPAIPNLPLCCPPCFSAIKMGAQRHIHN